jgi:23S rRNA pseudouridine1911/1915/1917 synthase
MEEKATRDPQPPLLGVHNVVISEACAGKRLDQALASLLDVPRVRVQEWVRAGCVRDVRGQKPKASHMVGEGEAYTLDIPGRAPVECATPAAPGSLNIVFEDADVLVVNKPAGLVVHPGAGHESDTLVHRLVSYTENLSTIGGPERRGVVHRLDKETSGLLLVAKHNAAHQALAAQFKDRTCSRLYDAIVWGRPLPPAGTIQRSIGRHPSHRQKQAIVASGRSAVTHYRFVKEVCGGRASLVRCSLGTGRMHQIRVHLASIGHPVVGDKVYGGGRSLHPLGEGVVRLWPAGRPALHAAELTFVHPTTQCVSTYTCAPPAIWSLYEKDA